MDEKIDDVEFDVDNINRLEIINHRIISGSGRKVVLDKSRGDFESLNFEIEQDGSIIKIVIK